MERKKKYHSPMAEVLVMESTPILGFGGTATAEIGDLDMPGEWGAKRGNHIIEDVDMGWEKEGADWDGMDLGF